MKIFDRLKTAFRPLQESEKPTGIIGKTMENDLPVIWKFVNELPCRSERDRLPWLTVISWKYDGTVRNGMPPQEINQRMLALEDALDEKVAIPALCHHAYSRTGNHLKEFVYYISDRDRFTARLNVVLQDHPRYPIEITFHEDRDCEDLQRLLADFSKIRGSE